MSLRHPLLPLALCHLPLLAFALAPQTQAAVRPAEVRLWEDAIVSLEVSSKQYDYFRPWTRGTQTLLKPAVAVGSDTLLTTAHGLAHLTVARAQPAGRGPWFNAQVAWIDHDANLALVSVNDPEFWRNRQTVTLSPTVPESDSLRIARWRGGSLELRKAEFNRFTINNPTGGGAAHVVLEVNSEINGIGWGEPLIANDQLVGLLFAQSGNVCHALPAPFIQSILQARQNDDYRGLGYFDFPWQPTENPEPLRYLQAPSPGQGVVIIDVPPLSPTAQILQARDLILAVDGFPIDNQGDYDDPLYGHLMLENLSTRNRWVGDRVPLKVWRNGAPVEIDYVLPPTRKAARLVAEPPADRPPEYSIVGGLVFQPFTRGYLRSWGPNWERSAPFRLAYFRFQDPTPETPSKVILSSVLPDPINLGYEDIRNLVLERVNSRTVCSLTDLHEALQQPKEGFHLFEFLEGEGLQRLVLDADQVEPANQRILARYGIEAAAEIH